MAWSARPDPIEGNTQNQQADDQRAASTVQIDLSLPSLTSGFSPLVFGDYELGSEIARGGMGVVYRAWQISLNRAVAFQMIARGEFASSALVQRFQLEASAAARLDHPNIVPIYEIGEHRGQVYYSMKLLEGGNLSARIANLKSEISSRDAARLLLQIAEAIHYAHPHGVLHRDLKPSNILLDSDGSLRVTDFGLAKVLEDEGGLTLSTATLGTPAYMAPEQAAGKSRDVSIAADIYSLGAILYELLTRRPPFQAETALATLRKVVEEEPLPPSQRRKEVTEDQGSVGNRPSDARRQKTHHSSSVAADLETICLKCLEK